jgi:hypothetical protein
MKSQIAPVPEKSPYRNVARGAWRNRIPVLLHPVIISAADRSPAPPENKPRSLILLHFPSPAASVRYNPHIVFAAPGSVTNGKENQLTPELTPEI